MEVIRKQLADGVNEHTGSIGQATAKLFSPGFSPTAHQIDAGFGSPGVFSVIVHPVVPVGLAQFKGGGVV